MILMEEKVIDDFLTSDLHKPFFCVVGDRDYDLILNALKKRTVSYIRVSDCCRSIDKKPDLDLLREELETADVSFKHDLIVLGLGEYLALEGDYYAQNCLADLANFNLGNAKAMLLLRCVGNQMKGLLRNDSRLSESGRIVFGDDLTSSIKLRFSDPSLGIYTLNGLKNVLKQLEDGEAGEISANTIMSFQDSLIPILKVNSSYEAIAKNMEVGVLVKNNGNDEMWGHLLKDLRENRFDISKVFIAHGLKEKTPSSFYQVIYGDEYTAWLYFIMLKLRQRDRSYIDHVSAISDDLCSFKSNILNSIIDIPHTEPCFREFYEERKNLVVGYPEPEIATFVLNNRKNISESIYHLTDNTLVEKQEIIRWISEYGIPDQLEKIYPDLSSYLAKYSFNTANNEFSKILTDYFETYKELKVENRLDSDKGKKFLKEVDLLARPDKRIYNRLPKRDELVKEMYTPTTQLFWVDALGVEYLGYLCSLAQNRGLSISVKIGRAELPTITCVNNNFFYMWPEQQRHSKEEELDEIKHKEKGGYYFTNEKTPIHLAKELDIIKKVFEEIATELGLGKYTHVVLTSDHGASRLAVLRDKEEKYETDTKGQHSGRCCKYFDGCDLPFAIPEKEKGYIVLADYGRFKGSRKANVEVHGGASLEEVVVPVIDLSLRDNSIKVSIVDPEKIRADFKNGINFVLYVNKSIPADMILVYDGKRYFTNKTDDNHYSVNIEDIKRAGTYQVDVYFGDDFIVQLNVEVKGKSATMNSDFDLPF